MKTRQTLNLRGHRTLPEMPIVDPGPIWKVDCARDREKSVFSHGIDPLRLHMSYCFREACQAGIPLIPIGNRRHSPAGCNICFLDRFSAPLPATLPLVRFLGSIAEIFQFSSTNFANYGS